MNKEKFRERKQLEQVIRKIDRDVDSIIVEGYCDKKVMENLDLKAGYFSLLKGQSKILQKM